MSVHGNLRGLLINGQGIPRYVVWLRSRSQSSNRHLSTTGLRGMPCPYMCPVNSRSSGRGIVHCQFAVITLPEDRFNRF